MICPRCEGTLELSDHVLILVDDHDQEVGRMNACSTCGGKGWRDDVVPVPRPQVEPCLVEA